jgi:hypothetical protein
MNTLACWLLYLTMGWLPTRRGAQIRREFQRWRKYRNVR